MPLVFQSNLSYNDSESEILDRKLLKSAIIHWSEAQ